MEQIAIMNAKSESLPEAMQEIKLAANFHDYKDSNLDKKSSVTSSSISFFSSLILEISA